MNEARFRRPKIRKRARMARMFRLLLERKSQVKRNTFAESKKENTYWGARVYLKIPGELMEDMFATSLIVKLPKNGPTQKIKELQENGFWVPRLHDGYMRYIPPQSILQVELYTDN